MSEPEKLGKEVIFDRLFYFIEVELQWLEVITRDLVVHNIPFVVKTSTMSLGCVKIKIYVEPKLKYHLEQFL